MQRINAMKYEEDGLSFDQNVKALLQNQPDVLAEFVEIIEESTHQSMKATRVIERASSLFRGHPDLIAGFNMVLPFDYIIDDRSIEEVDIPGTKSGGETTSAQSTDSPSSSTTASTNPKLSSQSNTSNPAASPYSSPRSALKKFQVLEDDAFSFLVKVKDKFKNEDHKYTEFLNILEDFQNHSRKNTGIIQRMSNLLREHPHLLRGFKQFLPHMYSAEPQPNKKVDTTGTNNVDGVAADQASFADSTSSSTSPIHPTPSSQSNNPKPAVSPHSSPGNSVIKVETET